MQAGFSFKPVTGQPPACIYPTRTLPPAQFGTHQNSMPKPNGFYADLGISFIISPHISVKMIVFIQFEGEEKT
jgi:hypothetical protein